MKKLLPVLLLALLAFAEVKAQCGNAFYRLKEGTEFEMTSYDKKDRPQGRTVNVISNVTENNGVYEATFTSKIYDKKDKLVTEGEFVILCEGNKVKIDMQRLLNSMEQMQAYESMEVEAEGDFMELPSDLEVGQNLSDAHTTMTVKMGESSATMSKIDIDINNRKVEAQEDISTPAGTFQCYKISYNTDMNMKVMGFGNKSSYGNVEWIAENVGTVRTENYDKKGNLNSYTLLTAYKE
ncbi:hypothetical protein OKW21_005709 [Catalinimonas alkaloidigena]|uniref:TapB family protein n=1 Tax=Catalinimonas alkaloidigena TaxID=1075417 RepID=UPI0024066194|nr:hypothetical protein [Catalinimonas alkaloidigena]MDF9800446.1 hypothetical protein [Catalinimonas alkaloidigena]